MNWWSHNARFLQYWHAKIQFHGQWSYYHYFWKHWYSLCDMEMLIVLPFLNKMFFYKFTKVYRNPILFIIYYDVYFYDLPDQRDKPSTQYQVSGICRTLVSLNGWIVSFLLLSFFIFTTSLSIVLMQDKTCLPLYTTNHSKMTSDIYNCKCFLGSLL